MKTIKLCGEIADEYKQEWCLDVQTPAEALRAINANRPGFLAECDAGHYVCVLVDELNPDSARQVTDKSGLEGWGREVLYVVPHVSGDYGVVAALVAYVGTTFLVAGGGLVTAVGTLTALGVAVAVVITIAVTIAISYIASLISGTPDGFGANETEDPENKPSYLFNGVVNTARQGHRLAVLYGGPMIVGSMVLSSRINTRDIPV